MSIAEWTHFTKVDCSPFDPRCSEWTALEIVRQAIAPTQELGPQTGRKRKILECVHPNNFVIPVSWKSKFKADPSLAGVSWEGWRSFIHPSGQSTGDGVTFIGTRATLLDYRHFNGDPTGVYSDPQERLLASVGRLLLGLLNHNHRAPRIWNIRGNERVTPLPMARLFQSLAISSPTLLLLESCLGSRSAENRAIPRQPELFGWHEGESVNDARFDPPALKNPTDLMKTIAHAQKVLIENQLSVSMNQPRQLIPVRLVDFSAGASIDVEDEVHGE